jgi:hypothetical protein
MSVYNNINDAKIYYVVSSKLKSNFFFPLFDSKCSEVMPYKGAGWERMGESKRKLKSNLILNTYLIKKDFCGQSHIEKTPMPVTKNYSFFK